MFDANIGRREHAKQHHHYGSPLAVPPATPMKKGSLRCPRAALRWGEPPLQAAGAGRRRMVAANAEAAPIDARDQRGNSMETRLTNASFRPTHLHVESASQAPLTSLYSIPAEDVFEV